MTHLDGIVFRVILLAKLPGNKGRCEVEKELRAHLDDLAEETRSQGCDDEAAARIVRMRFGEREEVAAAFASVYAPERLAKRILQSAILVTVSTVAVVVVIGTVQSIAAICTATSIISTLRDIHRELVGFGAIVASYCSVYAGERLFPTSLARALLPSVTLGLWLAAVFGWLIPQHAALPLAAFACAASGRLLQRVEIRLVWFAGTALPLLIAWALFGPLISGWQFPWLVWFRTVAVQARPKCGHCLKEGQIARFDPAGAIEIFADIHAVHHASIDLHCTTIAGIMCRSSGH